MKFSDKFERDWEFYYSNRKTFFLDPAKTAKECFYIFDSTGKCEPCSEIELLREIFNCKASVNFHIKMWAEGRAETISWAHGKVNKSSDRLGFYIMAWEELRDIKNDFNCPDWVIEAIKKQSLKITIIPDP